MGLPGKPQIGPIDRNALRSGISHLKNSIDSAYTELTGEPVTLSQEDVNQLFPTLTESMPITPVAPPAGMQPAAPAMGNAPQRRKGVSDEQVIKYQYKSVRAELMLMQKHLREGCKIDGTACDCCEKHPEQLEALALESYGMTAHPVFAQVAEWARKIQPITTEEASKSGQYDQAYPQLALEARELIKTLMGSGYVEENANGS